jgi:hypothetical protein
MAFHPSPTKRGDSQMKIRTHADVSLREVLNEPSIVLSFITLCVLCIIGFSFIKFYILLYFIFFCASHVF